MSMSNDLAEASVNSEDAHDFAGRVDLSISTDADSTCDQLRRGVPHGPRRCGFHRSALRHRVSVAAARAALRCRAVKAYRPAAMATAGRDPSFASSSICSAASARAARSGRGRGRRRNLHDRRDPVVDRRMGREQVGEAGARIVDAHLHHRRGRAFELAAAFDLAQRRDHGVRILGQLDGAGVGEVFAFARQREADDDREQPGHRDSASAMTMASTTPPEPLLLLLLLLRCRAPSGNPPWNNSAEHHLGEERDHARDDDRDHQHAHVAVADVRQLMAEHGLELRRRRAGRPAPRSP